MKTLRVDIWSDIACPWCYVGKRRFENALERFPESENVQVVWRAFELDPAAPRQRDPSVSYAARLAKKYGVPVARADAMIRNMTGVAAAEGLDFDFDRAKAGNTFDAHRLIHLALERGVQDRVKERLLRAYFSEGEPIGEPDVIARLGVEAGLDADEVASVLSSDTYARDVRADEDEARELGITGVPFFVLGGRYAVSGAQPADLLLEALSQAFGEAGSEAEHEHGAACGPDGCA
jgi:predicted DsbA family dithiol-disulfide isomerase